MRSIIRSFALLLVVACADQPGTDTTDESQDAVSARYGVDYSFARPSIPGIRAQGYKFVARYVSHVPAKNITHAEAQDLIRNNLDVVINWEQNATDALGGYNLGRQFAQAAEQQALAAGMPATRPIYFSVDFDATPGDQAAINSYFDGVASVIGRSRTGAYGGYWVIKRLFDAHKIKWGWQAFAWSGGLWDSRAQVRQIENGLDNGSEDKDQAIAADFGQWGANVAPRGYLDTLSCSTVGGWSQDLSSPTAANRVHLYFDSVPGAAGAHAAATTANRYRGDLCHPLGSCDHAYLSPVPLSFRNNASHSVRAYGIDLTTTAHTLLANSPKRVACSGALPAGVKRWVINPKAFAAWKFNSYWDAIRPNAAQYATRQDGVNFPSSLTCMRASGQPAVYVLDSGRKRHIVSPASAAAWRIDLAKCQIWTAARLASIPEGPKWRATPVLADYRGKIVVIDDEPNGPASFAPEAADPSDGEIDPNVVPAEQELVVDDDVDPDLLDLDVEEALDGSDGDGSGDGEPTYDGR